MPRAMMQGVGEHIRRCVADQGQPLLAWWRTSRRGGAAGGTGTIATNWATLASVAFDATAAEITALTARPPTWGNGGKGQGMSCHPVHALTMGQPLSFLMEPCADIGNAEQRALVSFQALAVFVLDEIRRLTNGVGYQLVLREQLEFTGDTSWSQEVVEIASTNGFWKYYLDAKFWELPLLQQAVDAHIAAGYFDVPAFTDASGKSVPSPSSALVAGALVGRLIKPILAHVAASRSSAVSTSQLDVIHGRILAFWRNPILHHVVTLPIWGLEPPPSEFEVLGILRVRAMTPSDKTTLVRALGDFDHLRPMDIAGLKAGGFGECESRMGAPTGNERHFQAADALITAMRLLKKGRVGIDHMFTRSIEPEFPGGGSRSDFEQLSAWLPFGYCLSAQDVPVLQNLATKLDRVRSRPEFAKIAVGVRRFNLSYSRRFSE